MVKFRGKRLDNGKWIEGDLVCCSGKHAYIIGYFEKGEYLPKEDLWACKCVVHKVKLETVGMGVEIDGKWYFEGDLAIAAWYDHGELTMKLTGEIIFSEGWKCFCIWDGESKTISELNAAGNEDWVLEKVGTKWDNPELLGG